VEPVNRILYFIVLAIYVVFAVVIARYVISAALNTVNISVSNELLTGGLLVIFAVLINGELRRIIKRGGMKWLLHKQKSK